MEPGLHSGSGRHTAIRLTWAPSRRSAPRWRERPLLGRTYCAARKPAMRRNRKRPRVNRIAK